jgi:hypothetical protein
MLKTRRGRAGFVLGLTSLVVLPCIICLCGLTYIAWQQGYLPIEDLLRTLSPERAVGEYLRALKGEHLWYLASVWIR